MLAIPIVYQNKNGGHQAGKVYASHGRGELQRWYFDSQPLPPFCPIHIRRKSTADIIAKLSIVEEEADECLYWMELLVEPGLVPEAKLKSLIAEVNEIVAMTVQSIKTLRARSQKTSNLKSKIPRAR
ncbi:four helix bundle protein [Egbenema bharatensis]|uniref:four helix bundle protein n=1 Tax=Egbenema bharatensis TaxID=3463334 RepID=UPI003A86AB54